ncbi:hypothetical protein GCM10011371_00890 [Novosphingobium marinum]|uniref:SnoaL-like domain-containing protein n=1 Tax=Novosphingobium marinum TaxID=1514948 RepID=A0A7Y9XVA9_9SPHN|nr:nuclear transport factor 2 family protein [Novosphingobium marinum]NYH93781.1 hypothetical protein [Novosphingobium marinum]GGC17235.1 hypothetical protein GCM10011371_00890 [Novosphingobium marinum]
MPFTGPLEDRIAIRETMETYAYGVMTIDEDLWASTWAEDSYWALPEYPDLGGFEGKKAIVEAWAGSMKVYGLDGCKKPMVYLAHPGRIEIDGDKARATTFTIEIYEHPETKETVHTNGHYEDELAKIDGKWVFTRREYRIFDERRD